MITTYLDRKVCTGTQEERWLSYRNVGTVHGYSGVTNTACIATSTHSHTTYIYIPTHSASATQRTAMTEAAVVLFLFNNALTNGFGRMHSELIVGIR